MYVSQKSNSLYLWAELEDIFLDDEGIIILSQGIVGY